MRKCTFSRAPRGPELPLPAHIAENPRSWRGDLLSRSLPRGRQRSSCCQTASRPDVQRQEAPQVFLT